MRRAAFLMLVIAAGLVGLALLAVPDATGAFFAWGLQPAGLAAFAGGVYVGSALVYAAGLRASRHHAQPLVVAAAVLSVSVLAATFAHLAVFDFDRLQAWAWVALFAAFGATTTALAVTGPWRREPGPALPGWVRGLLGAVAAALLVAAVALWVDPAAFELPPLGGRFAGAWAAMLATLAAWPAVRGRRDEARLPALALVALPAAALVAALRTLGDPDPRYLAALALLMAAGATTSAALRRARPAADPRVERPPPAEEPVDPLVATGRDLARRARATAAARPSARAGSRRQSSREARPGRRRGPTSTTSACGAASIAASAPPGRGAATWSHLARPARPPRRGRPRSSRSMPRRAPRGRRSCRPRGRSAPRRRRRGPRVIAAISTSVSPPRGSTKRFGRRWPRTSMSGSSRSASCSTMRGRRRWRHSSCVQDEQRVALAGVAAEHDDRAPRRPRAPPPPPSDSVDRDVDARPAAVIVR